MYEENTILQPKNELDLCFGSENPDRRCFLGWCSSLRHKPCVAGCVADDTYVAAYVACLCRTLCRVLCRTLCRIPYTTQPLCRY
jgi:hypothetical protein